VVATSRTNLSLAFTNISKNVEQYREQRRLQALQVQKEQQETAGNADPENATDTDDKDKAAAPEKNKTPSVLSATSSKLPIPISSYGNGSRTLCSCTNITDCNRHRKTRCSRRLLFQLGILGRRKEKGLRGSQKPRSALLPRPRGCRPTFGQIVAIQSVVKEFAGSYVQVTTQGRGSQELGGGYACAVG